MEKEKKNKKLLFIFAVSIIIFTIATISAEGCCFDSEEGTCSPNSIKVECEEDEGDWYNSETCNINECEAGCCVLELETKFITRRACEAQAEAAGLVTEFRTNLDEATCTGLSENLGAGACVIEDEEGNGCKFTIESQCNVLEGEFHEGKLCSHPDLDTICEKQTSISCSVGLDEIYWFDSCGNRENIYSSNKYQSYNSGEVLSKDEACYPDSDNSDSSKCGNCNYELGSICSSYVDGQGTEMKEGGYSCRNLNCEDALTGIDDETQDRRNTESWCVYEGRIGNGRDVVGSRHYEYSCVNGQVQVEPCEDKRQEVCAEKEKELSNGDIISEAFCRTNLWEKCIKYNGGGGCVGVCLLKCGVNPDCRIQSTVVGANFIFNTCVPKYPPGFEEQNKSYLEILARGIIRGAGTEFITDILRDPDVWGETIGEVISVDDPLSDAIPSEYRAPLGRFVEGNILNNIANPGKVSPSRICSLGTKSCNFKLNPLCKTPLFAIQMNELCFRLGDCGGYTNIDGKVTQKGYFIFSGNLLVLALQYIPTLILVEQTYGDYAQTPLEQPKVYSGEIGDIELLKWVEKIPSLGLSYVFGFGITRINEPGAGEETLENIVKRFPVLNIVKDVSETTSPKKVSFFCLPWQAPGGENQNCEFCNEDPMKPCTQYRCDSLGKKCIFIEEDGTCVIEEPEDDGVADEILVISPFDDFDEDDQGIEYFDETETGFNIRNEEEECLEAFEFYSFGVSTNIPAICKFGMADADFEELPGPFIEAEEFTEGHTLIRLLPSLESIIRTGAVMSDYYSDNQGNLDLYVKCIDEDEQETTEKYKINICVSIELDTTAPEITAWDPTTGFKVALDQTEQLINLHVKEPAECKWSTTSQTYDNMANQMDCITDVGSADLLGYSCSTTLPITDVENKFYFLCRDQPWLLTDVGKNTGEAVEYNLVRTPAGLEIYLISPSGIVFKGVELADIRLEITTSGGAEAGVADCEFNLDDEKVDEELIFEDMEGAGTNQHSYLLIGLVEGEHVVKIKCEDSAGNTAEGETTFILELDTTAPVVTSHNTDGGIITLTTDEESTCYYYNNQGMKCNFNLGDAIMSDPVTTEHTTAFNADLTYYIKCKDKWGNQPDSSHDSCSVVIN